MYQISFYVPIHNAEKVKTAMFTAGAGRFNNYKQCAWQTEGKGQFMPVGDAQPAIGELDELETIAEYKVEMMCPTDSLNAVISALKKEHPYEEVAYCVVKMETI
jgi:hypothetical protein